MAGNGRSKAYLCGQLYAALHALCILGTGSKELAGMGNMKKAFENPKNEMPKLLQSAGGHLLAAFGKGTEQATAASKIFRDIPGFIPPGSVGNGTGGDSADFTTGWCEQMSTYKQEYPKLLA